MPDTSIFVGPLAIPISFEAKSNNETISFFESLVVSRKWGYPIKNIGANIDNQNWDKLCKTF